MNKYFFILVLIILAISALLADTYYVDEDYPFETTFNKRSIQTAINSATTTGDEIIIYEADDGYYDEELEIISKNLIIQSAENNDVVIRGQNGITIDISGTISDITIDGLVLQNTDDERVLHVEADCSPIITIQNCVFDDSDIFMIDIEEASNVYLYDNSFNRSILGSEDLVRFSDGSTSSEISGNSFRNTTGGALNIADTEHVVIHNNEFKDCNGCIYFFNTDNSFTGYIDIYDNLIYDCTYDISGVMTLLGYSIGNVYNNTFVSNASRTPLPNLLDCNSDQHTDINVFVNNIMKGFNNFDDCILDNFPNEVDYCCYDGTLINPGTHNITSDPEFKPSASYSLEYYSPCINTGDDNSDYDDPDGSRADMGWNPYEHDIYKWSASASSRVYIWKCFPRLSFSPNTTNHGQEIDVDEAWEFWNPIPTGHVYAWYESDSPVVDGEYEFNVWSWDPYTYTVCSQYGYKLQRTGTGDPIMFSRGVLCDDDVELITTYEDDEDWLGYFLEDAQLVLDAFPSAVTNDAIKIWTQNWCISRNTVNDPWTGSPGSCYLHYMDAVIITTVYHDHRFEWETPARDDEVAYRPVTEHFTFLDELDYQPIYAYFEEENMPQEVAVYINDVCKGAQVVEDTICQICAYILEEDEGENIEFAFWYDDRSKIEHCNSYLVYNEASGEYKLQSLRTGTSGIHYKVSFKDDYENIVPPEYDLNCYPNPFNPELTISFNLKESQDVKLNIYNVRGQKVKTLVSELFRPNDYNIVWNGDDNVGNKVSSGVYYIRLQVGEDIVNRKVILMK